ncbi:transposase [Nocardia abscessus]|nr:transposase [Nocardia abscessus]
MVEAMLFRLRTGVPWRDLPEAFGPWQTVWKRRRRYAVSTPGESWIGHNFRDTGGRVCSVAQQDSLPE